MKVFSTILMTSFFALLNFYSSAQFLENLGKRVEDKVEETITRKAEDKAEEKTEEAVDGVFDAGKKKKKKTSDGSSSEELKTTYVFSFSATIVLESKEENTSNTMNQSYGDGYILGEMDGNRIIQDFDAEKVIVMDDENKSATVMSMKWMDRMMESVTKESKSDKSAKMVKTGKTKKILGYTCYEYLITSDDGETRIWFAPNVPFNYDNYIKSMAKIFGGKSNTIKKGQGYLMEMTTYDKNGKEISHMYVKSISEKIFNISLNDYTISSMM